MSSLIGQSRKHGFEECKEHKGGTEKDRAVTKTSGPQRAAGFGGSSGVLSITRAARLERWNDGNYSMTCRSVGIPIRSDGRSERESPGKLTVVWFPQHLSFVQYDYSFHQQYAGGYLIVFKWLIHFFQLLFWKSPQKYYLSDSMRCSAINPKRN